MAVMIRLSKTGKKKQYTYRVVVANRLSKRDGRVLETVGKYDARTRPVKLALKTDRVAYWLSKGAVPTATVAKLLKTAVTTSAAPVAA